MSKGFHPVTLRWVTEVGETRDMVTLFMRERFRSRSEAWNGFAGELGIRSDTPPSIELGGESDCMLRHGVVAIAYVMRALTHAGAVCVDGDGRKVVCSWLATVGE